MYQWGMNGYQQMGEQWSPVMSPGIMLNASPSTTEHVSEYWQVP